MDKWIIDEKTNLINLNHVEKIYVNDKFKYTNYDNEKTTYDEATYIVYDISVATTSGKTFFLGKTKIYYTEITYEYFILEFLFKAITDFEGKYIDFCHIADQLTKKYKEANVQKPSNI